MPTNAEGNALIITERIYNSGTLYNTTNVWSLYEDSNLKTAMDAWYGNTANVGASLSGIGIDYAYQDASGNSVNKLDTGVGVENDAAGASYNASAKSQKAITVAGATSTKGSVFALSVSEVNTYYDLGALNKVAYDATATTTARSWWLRSLGASASAVDFLGNVPHAHATNAALGFRLALWLHP